MYPFSVSFPPSLPPSLHLSLSLSLSLLMVLEQHAVEVELQETRLRQAESKQSLHFAQQQVEGLKDQLQQAAQVLPACVYGLFVWFVYMYVHVCVCGCVMHVCV